LTASCTTRHHNQTSLLDCCHDRKLTVTRGDARDKELVSELIKDVEVIIPLACLTGAPLCKKDPVSARTTNLDAIRMIVELRGKDQRIVFPTTNSGYGIGAQDKYCARPKRKKRFSMRATVSR